MSTKRRLPRMRPAIVGVLISAGATLFVATTAFRLAYAGSKGAARDAGLNVSDASWYPLCIEGVLVVAAVATVVLRSPYPWVVLLGFSALSIGANVQHAVDQPGKADWFMLLVAAVPPAALPLCVELSIRIVKKLTTRDPAAVTADYLAAAALAAHLHWLTTRKPAVSGTPESAPRYQGSGSLVLDTAPGAVTHRGATDPGADGPNTAPGSALHTPGAVTGPAAPGPSAPSRVAQPTGREVAPEGAAGGPQSPAGAPPAPTSGAPAGPHLTVVPGAPETAPPSAPGNAPRPRRVRAASAPGRSRVTAPVGAPDDDELADRLRALRVQTGEPLNTLRPVRKALHVGQDTARRVLAAVDEDAGGEAS